MHYTSNFSAFIRLADMGKIATDAAPDGHCCFQLLGCIGAWVLSHGRILWGLVPVGFVLVLACHGAAAAQTLTSADSIDLNGQIHYLEDPAGTQNLDLLLGEVADWQQNPNGVFNKGFNDSVWWLKVELHNPDAQAEERLLEIAYPILDQIGVYVIRSGSLIQDFHTGDALPFHSRPLITRNFVFPVHLPAQDVLTIYIRIQTGSAVQVPLTLWKRDAFFRHEANSNFLQGFYFGGTITLVLYNLLIFLMLRDRNYLYYVGFVASAPLFYLALSGLGFRYLWPQHTVWNSYATPIFLSFLVIFGALFTRRFLELKRFSVAMDRIILGFAITGVAALLISLYFPYRTSMPLLAVIVIFACLADILAGLFAWRRQVASARFYVLAWTLFLVGSIIFAFNKLNILPSNPFTENAAQVGSILEAVLLSFALADRINLERRLRFKAQEENLIAQMRTNETLELRVAERTRELAELNLKLEALSYTDQLTQLYNRRFLDDAAIKEWQRCLRKEADLSILLIDVDHFKQVNDRFGHEIGDYCLQQVGRQLRELLRWSTDIVARYGGEEFCVILPETNSFGALQSAQRILLAFSSKPLHTSKGPLPITVSIGISSTKAQPGLVLRTLFTEADAALYRAKSSGRNRAVLFSSSSEMS